MTNPQSPIKYQSGCVKFLLGKVRDRHAVLAEADVFCSNSCRLTFDPHIVHQARYRELHTTRTRSSDPTLMWPGCCSHGGRCQMVRVDASYLGGSAVGVVVFAGCGTRLIQRTKPAYRHLDLAVRCRPRREMRLVHAAALVRCGVQNHDFGLGFLQRGWALGSFPARLEQEVAGTTFLDYHAYHFVPDVLDTWMRPDYKC